MGIRKFEFAAKTSFYQHLTNRMQKYTREPKFAKFLQYFANDLFQIQLETNTLQF